MISDYNNLICLKLVEYIKFFLERIEASVDNTTIDLTRYNVIDTTNFDINYLNVHGLTNSFTLKCYFRVTENGQQGDEFDEDLEIPKMIHNVFVIGGALRIPTNTLDNDSTVTVYEQNVRLNEFINVSYEELDNGQLKLTLNIYEDEEPIVLDGTPEIFDKYKDKLKLSEDERNKIKVKLDTDDIGEYLTYDIVMGLINLGPDKMHDNMIDKRIYSAEANLLQYMWSRDIRKKVLTGMKTKFYQYKRIYLKDIQNAITRYFQIADQKNIDFPATINPLVFDSMKYKVIIPENVAYNSTMTDIIDFANTPVNGHTNYINELNVCSEIRDDGIYIKCYTFPNQEPVTIKYTTYCTKKVLINQYWDYDKKTFVDDTKPVKYKLRLKIKESNEYTGYDLIEPKADDKLSILSRRLPLGNMSDSVRVGMMGTPMQKQALELQDSQPALITSGHDDEDFELSTLVTRFKGTSSTVEKIDKGKIFLRDNKTRSVQFIEIPSPTVGANDSIISFDATVKVGDQVEKDSILVVPHMQRKKAFELGTNVNVIYMNYLGFTHEDGVAVSESLANRMRHFSIINVNLMLYPDDIIGYMKPIGSKVKSRDILVNCQTRLRVSKAIKDVYTGGGLLSGMGINFNQNNLIVPNNIDEGYLLDCRIELIEGRNLTSELTKETLEKYKNEKSTDYEFLEKKYKQLEADKLYELSDNVCGYISMKILRIDKLKTGDKTTNRYGSKGIISLVIPDKCMPQVEKPDGTRIPAEMLLTPSSVLHRKNVSQLYECALSKCIKEIYNRITEFISNGDIKSCRALLEQFKLVYGDKFEKMTDKEFIDYHKENGLIGYRMPVGFFSKIDYQKVTEWLKSLDLTETERIFCPDIVMVETKNGLSVMSPEDYIPKPGDRAKHYELGYCEQECVTGSEYIMKLFKQANYDGKVTSEVLEATEPVMGRGKYRWTGQKIGEMELWILIGTGIEKFVQEQSDTMKTSQYQFLNELLLSGYFIQDKQGNPLLSDQRSKQRALEQL